MYKYTQHILRAALVLFVVLAVPVGAVTDSFSIQTLVGDDTTPPTAPTGLIATGVSISQINLSWSSSTDDSGIISGYHVWRNDTLIATTTVTTFSDTGLASSTNYAYYVTAFDSFFNESASSSVATGTTLAPLPPEEQEQESGSSYGSKLHPFDELITALEVRAQKDSIFIEYTTASYVRTVVQWGKGISYELGSVAEQTFMTQHDTRLIGLVPGTTYTFVIRGEDRFGREGVLYTGTATTLPPDDVFPPGNVNGFAAEFEDPAVVLSWVNPEDSDFSKVRVLRSNLFYPSDTADGWVVYEGGGEMVRDMDVEQNTWQFYTIFTYDALGNISSGVVTRVYVGDEKSATSTPVVTDPTKNEIKLSIEDLIFEQEGTVFYADDLGQVRIDGAKQLTVSLPYERVPEHLKTILITIRDSRNNDREFSFLLRVNNERTAYVGTLAPFGVGGNFPIALSVFDYTTAQIGYAHGILIANIRPIHTQSDTAGFFMGFIEYLSKISESYLLWFIILLILLLLMSRRLMHRH